MAAHSITPSPHHPITHLDGVLVIHKPSGPTSHDVVSVARRVLGVRRIGHTGTLDPLARGVLPLVIGRATRLAQFFTRADKEYEADVRLGVRTTTYDATGDSVEAVRDREPASLTVNEIEEALAGFRGTHLQHPPAFSAKKISGIPAYRMARQKQAVDLAPVEVTVHALDVLAWQDERLRLRVVCSSGFYVRSLAHALGERLGTGACIEGLLRRRSGEFGLDRALPLADLERSPRESLGRIIPMPELLPALPGVVLTLEGVRQATRGGVIGPRHIAQWRGAPPPRRSLRSLSQRPANNDEPPLAGTSPHVRLLHPDGRLLAVAQPTHAEGTLHPGIVLE